jgi:hypothetical protein
LTGSGGELEPSALHSYKEKPMRVTRNLISRIKLATGKGYTHLVVKKGGNWNTPAIVEIPFEELLKVPVGTDFDTGKVGVFVTKDHPFKEDGIGYYEVMKLSL